MKHLLLLSLISFCASPLGLTVLDENKPVIYTVNQNPIAAYYGSTSSGFLAQSLPDYQVYASYIKDDFASSEAEKTSIVRTLVADIQRVRPKYVLVASVVLGAELKRLLPQYSILVFAYSAERSDIQLEDPGKHIALMIDIMRYEYDKFYILTDLSGKSRHEMSVLTQQLVNAGIPKSKIEEVRSRSTLVLESNLRSLNLKQRGVIINLLYSLPDTELNKVNYLPDVKEILARVNKKHLDIGFSRTAQDNECIILDYDLNRIRSFIERENNLIFIEPLRLEASFNINRMNKLKMKDLYLRGIKVVDEIIE